MRPTLCPELVQFVRMASAKIYAFTVWPSCTRKSSSVRTKSDRKSFWECTHSSTKSPPKNAILIGILLERRTDLNILKHHVWISLNTSFEYHFVDRTQLISTDSISLLLKKCFNFEQIERIALWVDLKLIWSWFRADLVPPRLLNGWTGAMNTARVTAAARMVQCLTVMRPPSLLNDWDCERLFFRRKLYNGRAISKLKRQFDGEVNEIAEC